MLRKFLPVVVLLLSQCVLVLGDDLPPGPKLLLNAQRLRRLKRDRERKTTRWMAFENRVNTVPDSPERGFELALYYVVTGDESKGREAVAWALAHQSARQALLVADWCAPLVSAEQKERLGGVPFAANGQMGFPLMRDVAFSAIVRGGEVKTDFSSRLNWLVNDGYKNPEELYALCELVYAVRASTHHDLREADAHFFSVLPELLLLSAKPSELSKPDWRRHAAALALVAIDPNLPSSQFLQGWALEDSQTIREGSGVAYELLWADPYLPGVGYQNMDTWLYDDHAHLFARAGWEANSCWIEISTKGVEHENCPPNWQSETVTFGRLTLMPITERCVEIPHIANHNDVVLVWKLKAGETITVGKGKEARGSDADAAGIWRPGSNFEGKACISGH